MKEKFEVFSIFKKFRSFVEKQSGQYIKMLRTDRKEYTSNAFQKFCEDEVLKRQLIISYTPRQNRVLEKKNHKVIEKAKSMFHEKGLPKEYWG